MKFDQLYDKIILETPWVALHTTIMFDLELEKIKTREDFINWIQSTFKNENEITDKYHNSVIITHDNIDNIIKEISNNKIFQKIADKYNIDFATIARNAFNDLQDVGNDQLSVGINVEKEHTSDPEIAERIARDHLAEDPNYLY